MTTATVAAKARALTDPDTAALASAPEKPEDLRTVEQVDWFAVIEAALDKERGSHMELPLPQLLLRIANTIAALAENGEHLKGFVGGTGRDQEDLAGSVAAALKRTGKKVSDQASTIAALERRVELLEAAITAPADASSVQALNASPTPASTR